MNTAVKNRQQLAQRLNEVTRDFRFHWGEPANCGDEVVWVTLHRHWDEQERLEYVGTIFPVRAPREFAGGLTWVVRKADSDAVCCEGRTDRRGCFRLRGLDEGEYTLEVGAPAAALDKPVCQPAIVELKPGQIRALIAQRVLAAATRVFERFHSADGVIRAAVVREASRGLVLEIQVSLEDPTVFATGTDDWEDAPPMVPQFGIYSDPAPVADEKSQPLAMGYVGMYRDGGNTAVGAIYLDRFPDRIKTVSDKYFVKVNVVSLADVTAADRQNLERSRDASEGPSRAALEAVVRQLEPVATT